MTVHDKLKDIKLLPMVTKPKSPVWDGPDSDAPNGGVTQGLITRFLTCRERARLYLVDGLRPAETFNHRLFFGSAWHVCEEALAAGVPSRRWETDLIEFAAGECKRYPFSREQVAHWTEVVRVTFPVYQEYWSKHPDVTERTQLLQEAKFSVPYPLPSGRTVILRGRWDSVDLIGRGKSRGVFLQENKTKGDIDEQKIKRQLSWDLQTMVYLVALQYCKEVGGTVTPPWSKSVILEKASRLPIIGVRYNVIRRPLSGGKGNIVRHQPTKGSKCPKCQGMGKGTIVGRLIGSNCPKCLGAGRVGGKPAESREAYYSRLGEYIKSEPETYFMRWSCTVTSGDLLRFRRECLDPILEQLCDWWSWVRVSGAAGPFSPNDGCENSLDQSVRSSIHWRTPYGLASPLLKGGYDDIDALLDTGSTAGMARVADVFPELKD